MKNALTFKKRKFQGGGLVGGGYTSVTLTPDIQVSPSVFSTFKLYETAQLPSIDKSKLKPELDLDKVKGHRNEVAQLYKMKSQLDQQLASLSDLDILANSEKFQSIMSQYNQLLSPRMLNELAVSKEYSEKAYAAAEKKGTFGEVNVKDGKFAMKSRDGKIQEVPLDKVDVYLQQGYQFLTTADLFHERDTNDNLAFNYQIDSRLSYGLSADELRKRFREQLVVGSSEEGKKGEAYRFVQKVIDEYGNKDVFEETSGGGRRIKKNHEQLKSALNTIISSMSQEEKDTLMGLVTRRLANQRIPITSENIAEEMYAYLFDLKESKKEDSDLQEGFTRLGSRITGSASGSQRLPEIGVVQLAMMGVGTQTGFSVMKGNQKIEARGVQVPVLEDLKTGTGKEERYLSLAETKKYSNLVDKNNLRLMNGSRVQSTDLILNPNEQPIITFAYRGNNGEYLIGNQAAEKANQVYNQAMENFIRENRNATPQQIEEFKNNLTRELLSRYKVEQVVVMNGWLPRKDELLRNMKEGVDYTEIDEDDNELVKRAAKQNSAKTEVPLYNWWGDDNFINTRVIAPVAPMSTIRLTIDNNKVYTPDKAMEDASVLAQRQQQELTSGRSFGGADINVFNAK